MNKFDKELRKRAAGERIEVPNSIHAMIDDVLNYLPDREISYDHRKERRKIKLQVAAAFFGAFLLLLNLNPKIASALEKIPVVGEIVRVITIRNYIQEEGNTGLKVRIPWVEYEEGESSAKLNESIEELTNRIIMKFHDEVDQYGTQIHLYTDVDYDIIMNSDRWFTLRINITETAASSNTSFQYYHIDKESGGIIQFTDLFVDETDYCEEISKNIKQQMREQMAQDSNVVYFLDSQVPESEFQSLDEDTNFYLSAEGDLVIIFNEYQVAPGSMGNPEFTIPYEVYGEYLKQEYQSLFRK